MWLVNKIYAFYKEFVFKDRLINCECIKIIAIRKLKDSREVVLEMMNTKSGKIFYKKPSDFYMDISSFSKMKDDDIDLVNSLLSYQRKDRLYPYINLEAIDFVNSECVFYNKISGNCFFMSFLELIHDNSVMKHIPDNHAEKINTIIKQMYD